MKFIELSCKPYFHHFRKPFKIAHGTRLGTDVVFLKLMYHNFEAFGEASLPPYLPDNVESTITFLVQEKFQKLELPEDLFHFSTEMNLEFPGNFPAKAALDMALWELKSKIQNTSISNLLNIKIEKVTPHTFTLGIGSQSEMQENIEYATNNGFKMFKLKLDGQRDEEIIEEFKLICDLPFAVDANQSWTDIEHSKRFAKYLEQNGCILIEQPFHKSDRQKSAELKSVIQIPLIADEACQTIDDVKELAMAFDGINIKLQKCGGISAAYEMINLAKQLDLKILIGCMSESKIACDAAESLSPLADWADLDGPWLIKENPNPTDIFG